MHWVSVNVAGDFENSGSGDMLNRFGRGQQSMLFYKHRYLIVSHRDSIEFAAFVFFVCIVVIPVALGKINGSFRGTTAPPQTV